MSKQLFQVLAIRHGVIEDNNQEYANVKVLQKELELSDGYKGVKVGKFKIVNRDLARQMLDKFKTPLQEFEFEFSTHFGSNEKIDLHVEAFTAK
jgi:hypothetical protein